MKRLEIRAYNLEDAKVKAFEQGITVIKNVTKDWKAAGQPILTKQLDAFGARILEENNLFPFNNAGVIIAINKGKKPLMRNIFRLVNFPKKGPRKMKRVVEIRNLDTDEFIKKAVTLMKDGLVNLESCVSEKIALEDYAKGLDMARKRPEGFVKAVFVNE